MMTAALVAGSLPFTLIVQRSQRTDLLLVLLYVGVIGAALARLTLPTIAWVPSTETLFGVSSFSSM